VAVRVRGRDGAAGRRPDRLERRSPWTSSLNTGVERGGHLRSADFFDTATFPKATFASTAIEGRGGNDYRVTGDLTIRDTTRPVTFDVEYLGLYRGMNGARRVGFHATASFNREDWGLTWNVALESGGWLVGKEIRLEIDVALEAAAPVAAQPGADSTAA
jgi:polyisoprenoid-binding protein YceI